MYLKYIDPSSNRIKEFQNNKNKFPSIISAPLNYIIKKIKNKLLVKDKEKAIKKLLKSSDSLNKQIKKSYLRNLELLGYPTQSRLYLFIHTYVPLLILLLLILNILAIVFFLPNENYGLIYPLAIGGAILSAIYSYFVK